MVKGKILFLCGKGGTGKDSVISSLLQQYPNEFERFVLTTTRPMRDSEVDGVEYHFCSMEDFAKRVVANEFCIVEHYSSAEGATKYYGVGEIPTDNDKVYVLCGTNTQYDKLRERYGDRVVGVYLYNTAYTSLTRMLSRLRDRKDVNVLEACRRILSDSQDYMYMDFNAFDLLINTENCTLSDEVALVHKLFE